MSLICPACQAGYNVTAAVLGPNGRKVRCPTCSHVWLGKAEDIQEVGATTRTTDPIPPIAPPPPDLRKNDFDGPQLRIIPAEIPASPFISQPARGEEPKAESHTGFRPIEAREPKKPASPIMVFFHQFFIPASLAMLAIVLATIVMGRETITKHAPGALTFYNLLSINPLPPGGGILLMNVRDESRIGQLDNALVIHGDLVNQTPSTLKVPLFKMEITSPNGQTKTFMARGPVEKIEPGASVPFTLERAGFAQQGWDVKLSFGDGSEKDSGKPMQSVDTPKPGSK